MVSFTNGGASSDRPKLLYCAVEEDQTISVDTATGVDNLPTDSVVDTYAWASDIATLSVTGLDSDGEYVMLGRSFGTHDEEAIRYGYYLNGDFIWLGVTSSASGNFGGSGQTVIFLENGDSLQLISDKVSVGGISEDFVISRHSMWVSRINN